MNKQEIFDTVVNHLFTQGKPAIEGTACRYRGENGTKCAVGVLIPDDEYVPKMENTSVWGLVNNLNVALPDYFAVNTDFLGDLQRVHDKSYKYDDKGIIVYLDFTPEYLNEGFGKVAKNHNLTYTPR